MLCQICLDEHAVAGTPFMHVAHVLLEQTLPLFELINKLSDMMPDGTTHEVLAMAYIPIMWHKYVWRIVGAMKELTKHDFNKFCCSIYTG